MRTSIPLSALAALILFSCQKEGDYANRSSNGNNGTGGNNSTSLLVKMVQKTGSDSLVTTYGYNANKKIISLKRLGIDDQGNFINAECHYHRNASGIITDYSIIDADLVGSGIDSITVIIHYTASQYTSYVINVPGITMLDSSIFVYDGSGKITGENFYESPSASGNDYYLSGIVNYIYSAEGNLTSITIHDLDQSGTETFTASTSPIAYDSKVNPIQTDNECFAVGHQEWISPTNIVSEQLSDSNGPIDNQTVTYAYTYNSENKPATNTITVVPDNKTVTTSFYYQ